MSDYKELLDELRSKWLFPCNTEAADLIERLIRERDEALAQVEALSINVKCACGYDNAADVCLVHTKMKAEARAKAIDEAAAAFRRCAPGAMLAGDVDHVEAYILALRDKPTVQE
jgi:hypothetical protein